MYSCIARYALLCGLFSYADPEGGGGPDPPPLENHKATGFLSNTGPHPLVNHKATKPALNIWPSSAGQRENSYSRHILV